MEKIFAFGERRDGYAVPVLNEREVRAAAGILFLCALLAFMNAWLIGNFRPTRLFVIAFLIDFTLRIFVNPQFSPSMILGRFAVRQQRPEYVGAPQKRFAWAVGWLLAVAMLILIVLNNVIGPLNLIVCAACLTLMFFESAFGICLACQVFNLFSRDKAQHCPGAVCEVGEGPNLPKIGGAQILILAAFLGMMGFIGQHYFPPDEVDARVENSPPAATIDGKCTPPDWAVAMGHSEMWKLHNNCK